MATYKINAGDTLSGIAAKQGTTIQNLMSLNPSITDPNKIQAGASLNLSPVAAPVDTSSFTPAQLQAYNNSAALATTPPAISAATLQGVTSPANVPPTPTTPPTPAIPSIKDIIDTSTAQTVATQNEQSDLMKNIQSLLTQQGGEAAQRAALEGQQGIPQKQQQLDEINARINEMTAQAKQAEVTSEGRLAPTFSIFGEQAQINRQLSSQTFGLAAAAAALTNQISRAQDYVTKAIDAEFGGIESQLKYQELLLNLNRDKMTAEEKKRADALQIQLTERSRLLEQEKADKTAVYNVMTSAAQNGADNATLEKIRNSKTQDEAILAAGRFASKSDLQFVSGTERQSAGYFDKTTGKFTPIGGGGVGDGATNLTGELKTQYGGLVDATANLVGAERGKTTRKAMAQAISSGDYVSAFAQVANNVEESLTGSPKITFADARTDYSVMTGMRNAIQEYADGGGDMGLLKGTEEDIKRKLGIDSGKASALAVQLWREFQTYRVNMTGAAFSPAESRDYAAVNPTLGKSLNLNLSVIDGALNQLENRVISTIETRVPGAKKLYQKVSNAEDGLSDDDAYQEYLKSQK